MMATFGSVHQLPHKRSVGLVVVLVDQDVEADHEIRCQSVASDDVEEIALYKLHASCNIWFRAMIDGERSMPVYSPENGSSLVTSMSPHPTSKMDRGWNSSITR